ncbi:MAG: fumarate hydratase [Candidatus Micrarchaeota archaeon]|nr:fumarate hydratase [Candidatus Micrarchaeota archaeon]
MFEREAFELVRKSVTVLPRDVEKAIRKAAEKEKGTAKVQMECILENIRIAKQKNIPLCQDTGWPIFFIFGKKMPGIDFESVVRKATKEAVIRPNMVDPLTRENTGDNTGTDAPFVNFVHCDTGYTDVWYMPKGGGGENMSMVAMLNPLDGWGRIKEFALETVRLAGGKACPPVIIGLGIGGTIDHCALLAKKALLRRIDRPNKRERELLKEINALGIGPMGVGGKTTCLGVNMETAATHTGALPVAVNIQCWCARRAGMRIKGGEVRWI